MLGITHCSVVWTAKTHPDICNLEGKLLPSVLGKWYELRFVIQEYVVMQLVEINWFRTRPWLFTWGNFKAVARYWNVDNNGIYMLEQRAFSSVLCFHILMNHWQALLRWIKVTYLILFTLRTLSYQCTCVKFNTERGIGILGLIYGVRIINRSVKMLRFLAN